MWYVSGNRDERKFEANVLDFERKMRATTSPSGSVFLLLW